MKNFPAALKQFCRRNPVLTGSVIFCLIPVLAWVAFDAYSRIRLASAIQRIEREGISCRLPDFRERYAPSPEAVLAEFTRLGEAMQTAESKYSPPWTPEQDSAALVAGEAALLKEADAFLDRNPRIGFARMFEGEAAFRQQLPELFFCLAWTRVNAGRILLRRPSVPPARTAAATFRSGAAGEKKRNNPIPGIPGIGGKRSFGKPDSFQISDAGPCGQADAVRNDFGRTGFAEMIVGRQEFSCGFQCDQFRMRDRPDSGDRSSVRLLPRCGIDPVCSRESCLAGAGWAHPDQRRIGRISRFGRQVDPEQSEMSFASGRKKLLHGTETVGENLVNSCAEGEKECSRK